MPVEGLPWLRSGGWGMAVGCGLLRTQLQLHPCPTHQLLRLRLCLQELIVDPKSFSTPANLEAAPGSQPNPLLAHGSAASSSSSSSSSAAAAGAAGGGGSAPGSAPGSARAAAAAAAAEAELQRLALSQDDHPLSTSSSSKWQSYFKVGVSLCRGHRRGESLRLHHAVLRAAAVPMARCCWVLLVQPQLLLPLLRCCWVLLVRPQLPLPPSWRLPMCPCRCADAILSSLASAPPGCGGSGADRAGCGAHTPRHALLLR